MSCLVVKMASVYKKRREARGALLEREVLLRQVRCSLLRPPHYRPTSGRRWESAENKRAAETQFTLSLSLSLARVRWRDERQLATPSPLYVLLRKCRARFRVYRSHVWWESRLRNRGWNGWRRMAARWSRRFLGTSNETRGQTCRIKGFCN